MVDLAVGQLHGARARRHAGELLRHLGHGADARRAAARPSAASCTACEKYLLSSLLKSLALGAELVGPRVHDRADQVLDVELVGDEVLGQGVEQLVVGRRVGVAEVVDRIDDAPAEQVDTRCG